MDHAPEQHVFSRDREICNPLEVSDMMKLPLREPVPRAVVSNISRVCHHFEKSWCSQDICRCFYVRPRVKFQVGVRVTAIYRSVCKCFRQDIREEHDYPPVSLRPEDCGPGYLVLARLQRRWRLMKIVIWCKNHPNEIGSPNPSDIEDSICDVKSKVGVFRLELSEWLMKVDVDHPMQIVGHVGEDCVETNILGSAGREVEIIGTQVPGEFGVFGWGLELHITDLDTGPLAQQHGGFRGTPLLVDVPHHAQLDVAKRKRFVCQLRSLIVEAITV
jgi:hypothetical protein